MIVLTKPAAIRFDIVDLHTQAVVGTAKTRTRGYQSAEKRNQKYGAHRYACKAIYA